MGNVAAAKKLREKQAVDKKEETTEALAAEGTTATTVTALKKSVEELSNAKAIVKDRDARIAELEESVEEKSKKIDTLNAMVEQGKKRSQVESDGLHKEIAALKKK